MIPGMLEPKEIKERNEKLIKKKDKGDSFFNNLKFALKQKNFLVYILVIYLKWYSGCLFLARFIIG